MKIPSNVRKKDGFWKLLPILYSKKTNTPIFSKIYLNEETWNGVHSKPQDLYSLGILIHELEHLKRQKQIGVVKWWLLYVLSPSFRFNEEWIAQRPQMKYLKKKRYKFDFDKRAKQLSGAAYGWAISQNNAKKKLQEIWEKC